MTNPINLIEAFKTARAALDARYVSVGRQAPEFGEMTFRFEGSTYRAEFKGNRKPKIFEIASHAINLRYGNRPETRRV
jgi:hypothetical protein